MDDVSETGTIRARLDADGAATLQNMPTGTSRWEGDVVCLVTSGDSYSGPATWQRDGDYRLILSFADSKVIVNSDTQLGEPDWSVLQFIECGSGPHRSWGMSVQCGVPSPNADSRYATRCGYAGRFVDADAVGVWRATTGVIDSVITVRSDKTFEIANWPARVNCVKPYATSTGQLKPTEVEDVTGYWSITSDGNGRGPLLLFNECPSSLAPSISQGEDGRLEMTIELGPVLSTTSEPNKVLVFRKN